MIRISAIVITFLLFITINSATFFVPEGSQAIITEFGKIKGKPIQTAGLKFKVPFIQEPRFFDKRILSWDGDAEQIPTKDKKYIWVDTTARWRIIDAVKFTQTLKNENQARTTLDGILDGVTRDTISNFKLVEAVRNTNTILDNIKQKKEDAKVNNIKFDEETTGELEKITTGREKISSIIVDRARAELKSFGIELIDLQLRSIAYEKNVQTKVYSRMISERKRVAEKIRSYGQGEQQKIKGRLDQDLKKIESESYKISQEIKGTAEATAIKIYADAMEKGKEFYNFSKNLEVYEKTLKGKTKFILSTDSDFLKLLNKGTN